MRKRNAERRRDEENGRGKEKEGGEHGTTV